MADNNLQKFESTNPLQKWFIDRFYKDLITLFSRLKGISKVLDVGCGEGFTIRKLQMYFPELHYSGIDPDVDALHYAKEKDHKSTYNEGSIYHIPFPDNSFDVVLCNEVLEHLKNPEKAMQELCRVTQSYIFLSVPHEPWFRVANLLRGRNIRRFGNYPYHIQYWTKSLFSRFVGNYAKVEQVKVPFPWILVKAKKIKK